MDDRATEITELMEDVENFLTEAPENPDEPKKHTLLESWQALLGVIELAMAEKPDPRMGIRVLGHHPYLKMSEVLDYHLRYHELLLQIRDVLAFEIESDAECLGRLDDDGKENHHHYLNLLINWQRLVHEWELEWDCGLSDAGITAAAIQDVASFVLGEQGMVAHLEQIDFRFTEEDNAVMAAALGLAAEEGE